MCFCGELSHTNGGNRGGSLLCKNHTLLERFWENVDVRGENDCWEWQASRTTAGYGVIYWNGENTYTHRLSLEFDNRPVSSRFHACHTCDNPPCVNPKHLFVGSPRGNMLDKVAKGRHTHGENHPHSKLSDLEISEIRRLVSENGIIVDIAKQFNVSRGYVTELASNRKRIKRESH